MFKVDNPEQFPLTAAIAHISTPELKVTGTVPLDVANLTVPVILLADGRVVEIDARSWDTVKKGQLQNRVHS